MLEIKIEGLEALVEEKVAAALDARTPDTGWLDSKEAAAYLGLARSTLHDLVSDGKLPRHGEPGTKLRFRREDLDAYATRSRDGSTGRVQAKSDDYIKRGGTVDAARPRQQEVDS